MTDTLNDLRNMGRHIAPLAEKIRELAGDDDLAFADTLDGETDAIKAASQAVRMVAAMEGLSEAAKALADRYAARGGDFDARAARARAALAHFMQEIGERKLVLPEGTLTLAAGSPSVVGEPNVEVLPPHLVRTTKSPDRVAIKAALKAGESVDGCHLSNAQPRLQIRTR